MSSPEQFAMVFIRLYHANWVW